MMLTESPTLLIIDDYAEIRHLLRRSLEDTYTCHEASCARDAIAILQTTKVDVVLLDLELVDARGLDWLAEGSVQADGRIVISMSGSIDPDIGDRAMRFGAADHISKPFSIGAVCARISAALASSILRHPPIGRPRKNAANEDSALCSLRD